MKPAESMLPSSPPPTSEPTPGARTASAIIPTRPRVLLVDELPPPSGCDWNTTTSALRMRVRRQSEQHAGSIIDYADGRQASGVPAGTAQEARHGLARTAFRLPDHLTGSTTC